MPAGVGDAEPHAQAPSVHRRSSCLQFQGQEAAGSRTLANCPLVWEAAALPPAAPSQDLCCWVLAGEGVMGGDHYLATPGQILLSFLASAGKTAVYMADKPSVAELRQIAFPRGRRVWVGELQAL